MENDYKDIDSLLGDLNQQKQQDFAKQPPQPEQTANNDFQENINNPDDPYFGKQPAENMAKALSSAKFVVTSIDFGISEIAGMISKEKDVSKYRADDEEKNELQQVYAEYLKDKAGDIPPGLMCLIMTGTIYGPKLKTAFDQKKANERETELLKQIKELKEKLNESTKTE